MILMNMAATPALRRTAIALGLAAPLLLAGCGSPLGGGDGDGPRVAASFYPLAYVAERVAGEHAAVVNLTSPGVEPHDLELTFKQTATLSDADLVVYEKGMQPAVDDAVAQNGPGEAVEVTDVIALEPADPEHADESAEEHADHADTDVDLHFWLDPKRMATLATEVETAMAEVDPAHADAYRANARALQQDLLDLDDAYRTGLADCAVDTVVVSHDAFGYLERYGLHFESIAGISPDVEPSPAQVARLQDLIREEGVTTVFSEPLASDAMSTSIATDLGLQTSVLDPIEGLGDRTADEDYLSLMRQNLAALQEASQCR
jgi:zinc transport system substrate-binding protein